MENERPIDGSQRWAMRFRFDAEFGEFEEKDFDGEFKSGCDAFLGFQVLRYRNGSLGVTSFQWDGTKPDRKLSDEDVFRIWGVLGRQLAEKLSEGDWKKTFATMAMNSLTEVMNIQGVQG